MKFGEQLELGMVDAWKQLKRLIARQKFIRDKQLGTGEDRSSNNSDTNPSPRDRDASGGLGEKSFGHYDKNNKDSYEITVDERTPLNISGKSSGTKAADFGSTSNEKKKDKGEKKKDKEKVKDKSKEKEGGKPKGKDDSGDYLIPFEDFPVDTPGQEENFFDVIDSDLIKVDEFFISKVNENRLKLDTIVQKRKAASKSHHTGGSQSDLVALRDIYLSLTTLKTFSELNQEGFRKIIKKYDKTMGESNLKDGYKQKIDGKVFACSSDVNDLREILVSLISPNKLIEWERFAEEQQLKGKDDIFPSVRFHGLVISLLLFFLSLVLPLPGLISNDLQASRCLSLLILTVSLWITQAIPYFATALFIPPLVTLLGVLKDPSDPSRSMTPEMASSFVLDHIFNHTTMLLLGGYTISTAFSRCQLELRMASFLQEMYGNQPHYFILAVMMLGLFLSMWISNHTAPILCATIILPIVRDLPTDSRFSKALLLGLAFACNFGGMMTPISSLQNALAVSQLEQAGIQVSFGRWLLVSIPFCVLCTLISWFLIIFLIPPTDISRIPIIVMKERASADIFSKKNIAVIGLSGLTIVLFATSSFTKFIFGDIGIISLCFVGFMFGSGLLTEVDFNSLSWHTLFLVGGGNVLGKAVESSGLLAYITLGITNSLPQHKQWLALMAILCFAGTVSNFVSHTVSSIILMPIISKIGIELGIPEIMVIGSAFCISGAMALPFSSFPNVNSLLIVDDFQKPYLGVSDYLLVGVPMSILSIILIATIGIYLISTFLV